MSDSVGITFDAEGLAHTLRRRRKIKNVSLREVAAGAGVSASTLSRIESGKGLPDIETYARVIAWLNLPFDAFLPGCSATDAAAGPAIIERILTSDPQLEEGHAKFLADQLWAGYQHLIAAESEQPKSP